MDSVQEITNTELYIIVGFEIITPVPCLILDSRESLKACCLPPG
jgi:hypothetical protein